MTASKWPSGIDCEKLSVFASTYSVLNSFFVGVRFVFSVFDSANSVFESCKSVFDSAFSVFCSRGLSESYMERRIGRGAFLVYLGFTYFYLLLTWGRSRMKSGLEWVLVVCTL